MKTITIKCDLCDTNFEKPVNEYNRSVRLNRNNYCSRSCSGKSRKNLNHLLRIKPDYPIKNHCFNQKDQFTGFRDHLRSCKRRNKSCNLDLQYLKDIWESQKGICPYTNLNLTLKRSKNYTTQASLDRIDSSKGYLKGNVEFVSLPINYLKADKLSKKETIEFLRTISSNFH